MLNGNNDYIDRLSPSADMIKCKGRHGGNLVKTCFNGRACRIFYINHFGDDLKRQPQVKTHRRNKDALKEKEVSINVLMVNGEHSLSLMMKANADVRPLLVPVSPN